MKTRQVILYWLLLVCSAGLIAALMTRLLHHEQERVDIVARRAAEEQARLIAERVSLTVEDVELILLHKLQSIPPETLLPTLQSWVKENPLVRGAFVIDENGHMLLPNPGGPLTTEERAFLHRLEPLREEGNLLAVSARRDERNTPLGQNAPSAPPAPVAGPAAPVMVAEASEQTKSKESRGTTLEFKIVAVPQRQAIALARKAPLQKTSLEDVLARDEAKGDVEVETDRPSASAAGAPTLAMNEERKDLAAAPAAMAEPRAGEMPEATKKSDLDAVAATPPATVPPTAPVVAALAPERRLEEKDAGGRYSSSATSTWGVASAAVSPSHEAARNAPRRRAATAGWSPWFAENGMNLVAWVRPSEGSVALYGIELELMTLMSTLVGELPSTMPAGLGYAIHDDNGRIVHQIGDIAGTKPPRMFTLSLAPVLPHWEVGLYSTGANENSLHRYQFLLITSFAVILLVSIVSGGTLLLRQAQRHYVDALRKTSFVSNVSHELKTPLTTIRLYAELLSQNRVPTPEKRGHYLHVIVDEAQRLTRLVNNVLDFSRLEQNRKKYRIAPIDVANLLRETVEAHRRRIEEAGLKVEAVLDGPPMTLRTDRDAIEQALLNLIDNAIKYAAGGGELRIELARAPDGRAQIRVCDRGPGVPPASRERIFEQFYRVDDSLTAQQPGTGLGLAIARRLLRDLGGDVRCEARPGGGACFVVLVGEAEEEAAQMPGRTS